MRFLMTMILLLAVAFPARAELVDWSVIDGETSAVDFARRLAKAPLSIKM